MGGIEYEFFRFNCPDFADVFVGCQATESFETASVIVGIDEVIEMITELAMIIVMVAFNGSIFDASVHSLDLAVCPRMPDFCEPVLNPVFPTTHVEHMVHIGCSWPIFVTRRECILDAIVGENNIDLVGHSFNQGFKKG